MSRYRWNNWRTEEIPTVAGDSSFVALDQKTTDPSLLTAGTLRISENARLLNGVAMTRGGVVAPISLDNTTFGPILGRGLFADPNSFRWELIAVAAGVWAVADGRTSQFIGLPTGTTLTGPVELVTCFSVVIMFQGPNLAPLYWAGTQSGGYFTGSFGALPTPLDGTKVTIPNAVTGEFVADRLLVPHDKDSMAVSDIGDYTSYTLNFSDFQINAGEADNLVRVFPWINNAVLLFKDRSIYVAQNVTGDLSTMTMSPVTKGLGLCGRKAAVLVGNEVFFMDRGEGVSKISQIFENTPETRALPISEPIKPTIDSINWAYGAGIVAARRREHVYFAVPLGSSTRNNALLVWNIVNQGWESVDTFANANFGIEDLILLDYGGDRRLVALDFVNGQFVLLEEGSSDNFTMSSAGSYPIKFHIRTRGYAGPGKRNSYRRFGVSLATWNPMFSINVYFDGVGRSNNVVTNKTKSNTSYYTFGRADWVPTNINNDWGTPGRRDYSVNTMQPLYLGSGIVVDQKQEIWENYFVDRPGKYCEVDITNSQGAIEVRSLVFEDQEDQREDRTQV